jgi:hypothetical protein
MWGSTSQKVPPYSFDVRASRAVRTPVQRLGNSAYSCRSSKHGARLTHKTEDLQKDFYHFDRGTSFALLVSICSLRRVFMKKVEAIIKPFKLDEVKDALAL